VLLLLLYKLIVGCVTPPPPPQDGPLHLVSSTALLYCYKDTSHHGYEQIIIASGIAEHRPFPARRSE
jgi:hypothetical protein